MSLLLFEGNKTGLGDKLLGIIGFIVYCKYTNHIPYVYLNANTYYHPWGSNIYDERLFQIEDVYFVNRDRTKL
jgi:hypothetical protein